VSAADDLARDGFVVLPKLFYPTAIGALQSDIRSLIMAAGMARAFQRPDLGAMEFYLDDDAPLVLEGAKQLRSLHRLISDADAMATISKLRPVFLPGIAEGGIQVRADMPNDERWSTHWHQDGTFQGRAHDGLTFWAPLLLVTADMGPVEICVGSHKDGLLPIHIPPGAYDTGRSRSYVWEIENVEDEVAKYDVVAPLTNPGDVIVMDYATIHRSGRNVSTIPRWSALWRYFNLCDPAGIAMGWKRPAQFGPNA
jgi:phytanoyl-CoA dioxygenase PhyH